MENAKNILIYYISYKIFMGAKPLRIWLENVDGFIKMMQLIRHVKKVAS